MLNEGDSCRLDLGSLVLPAHIVGFHGADVALTITGVDDALSAQLRSAYGAHLLLRAGTATRAQPGIVMYSGSGDLILFRTSDHAYEGLQRKHSRAPLPLDVIVAPVSDQFGHEPRMKTTTIDIGAGGLRIPRLEEPLERARLTITLPDGTIVSLIAALNRSGGEDTVYTFERFTANDRSRISGFVLGWHLERQRAA